MAIILPLAKQDIKEAAVWYNQQQKGLGKRFTTTVREKLAFVRQHPQATAIRYGDTRTAPLETFPYMVHFTIDDEKQLVIVSAVLSTHQSPENWKNR